MTVSRVTTQWLRQVMATLTVMAAFMFQVRLDGMGGLIQPAEHTAQVSRVHNPLSALIPTASERLCGEQQSGPHASSSAPRAQSGPARQAPAQRGSSHAPSEHTPSEHCPFCVTNAFGLEAADVSLVDACGAFLPGLHLALRFPHLTAWRHADARAPPVL